VLKVDQEFFLGTEGLSIFNDREEHDVAFILEKNFEGVQQVREMPPRVSFEAEDEGLYWNENDQVNYFSITGGDSLMFKAM